MPASHTISVHNERLKLFAGFLNALGLGLIGFAILRPATEAITLVGPSAWLWSVAGLAFHALAHYLLGYLREDK